MAARAAWKGTLKLSLINIPIRVFPATSASSDVSFRQLHRRCHTPIQLKKWCPHCHEEVESADIVKGYEASKGRFVIVEEKEIAALRPEATHTVELSHILDASQIDPIYIERSYYLAPDAKTAGSPFSVLRDALSDRAAVGHLALHGREYLVAVVQRDEALLMHTLRTVGEVRDLDSVDGLEYADVKVKPDELRLARQVLDSLETDTKLSDFTDHYEAALRELVASKGEGEIVAEAGAARGKAPRVVNLMDALRQSLEQVSKQKKHPARAPAARTARILKHPASRRAHKAS